jgi:hypothetical protein
MYLSQFHMQGPTLHTISFRVGVDYLKTSWWYKDFCSLVWCQRFASYMAVTMIWSIITNIHWTIIMLSDNFHTNSKTELGAMTLAADNSTFMVVELGSRWVWSVYKGWLFLLGTWSHPRYIRRSMLVHLFLWLVIPACAVRLITLWYLSHVIKIWCGLARDLNEYFVFIRVFAELSGNYSLIVAPEVLIRDWSKTRNGYPSLPSWSLKRMLKRLSLHLLIRDAISPLCFVFVFCKLGICNDITVFPDHGKLPIKDMSFFVFFFCMSDNPRKS